MSDEQAPVDEVFLSRWSRLKQEAEADLEQPLQTRDEVPGEQAEAPPVLTDEDMQPIESLTEDSDYSGFMSPGVSEELRQIALRKLFHSAAFNVCDGLDDYDEDFSSFAKLGSIVTADMRFQMEQEARKKMEELLTADQPPEVIEQEVEEIEQQDEFTAVLEEDSEPEMNDQIDTEETT